MPDVHYNYKQRIAHGLGLLRRYVTEKLGIEDYTKLSDEEKGTYDEWEAILTKEINLDDLAKHLDKEQVRLGRELREAVQSGDERKAQRLAARIDNYETIVSFIREPNQSRERLIENITSLLK